MGEAPISGRVCFLSRAGDGFAGVRLVGTRSDESWRAPPPAGEGTDAARVRSDIASAARWIAERAGVRLGLLCVDVEGSNCSWVNAPSVEPVMVAAAMDREGVSEGWRNGGLDSASVQALAPAPAGKRVVDPAGHRLSVLAVPDTLARLMLDALDDSGVDVARSVSLWHAMAMGWDPGSPVLAGSSVRGGALDGGAPVSGVVLVDPEAARLIWCWSQAGELLAGGVVMASATPEGAVKVAKSDLARLVSDWLGWSVQLGVAPVRIVCAAPDGDGAGTDADLSPAQVGAILGNSWSGATVDMAVHNDPIGATLSRLATAETTVGTDADGRASLVALSHRPGRVHRSMQWWTAAALIVGAAGLLGVGYKAWRGAGAAATEKDKIVEQNRKDVMDAAPPPSGDLVITETARGNPRGYLEERIASKLSQNKIPTGLTQAKPILAELENLSYVLGTDQIEVDQLILTESLVQAWVFVPDTLTAESLRDALKQVAGDHCDWALKFSEGGRTKENMKLVWLDGTWKANEGTP